MFYLFRFFQTKIYKFNPNTPPYSTCCSPRMHGRKPQLLFKTDSCLYTAINSSSLHAFGCFLKNNKERKRKRSELQAYKERKCMRKGQSSTKYILSRQTLSAVYCSLRNKKIYIFYCIKTLNIYLNTNLKSIKTKQNKIYTPLQQQSIPSAYDGSPAGLASHLHK